MKTYCDSFVLCKSNRNTCIIHHTVMKSCYTNVKYHCEVSWYFSVHCLPQSLWNYKEKAKIKPSEKALAMPGQLPPQWDSQYCQGDILYWIRALNITHQPLSIITANVSPRRVDKTCSPILLFPLLFCMCYVLYIVCQFKWIYVATGESESENLWLKLIN